MYAPQLAIPGFGGRLESQLEEELATLDISDYPALRDLSRLSSPARLASDYVNGPLMGPRGRYYAAFEYLAWLLSDASTWLPQELRDTLVQGMADWQSWAWWRGSDRPLEEFGFTSDPATGALVDTTITMAESGAFSSGVDLVNNSSDALRDLRHRVGFAVELLRLPDETDELVARFLAGGFLEALAEDAARRKALADNDDST